MLDKAVEHLQALGFSEYESRAYVTLLKQGPLTGYQLAKHSGIPRPNIYPVLDRLQQRGVVVSVQVEGGVKYAALPVAEMLASLSRNLESHLAQAQHSLGQLASAPNGDYLWNIQGYDNLINRAQGLMDGAQRRLLAATWSNEAARLAGAFSAALQRGVEPVVLCIQGCPHECGGCQGRIYRYPLSAGASSRWLVLVADGQRMLVGQVMPDGQARGAYTTLEVLVAVGTMYLQNAIASAEIVRSLGSRLLQLVDAQALEALQGTGLALDDTSWFQRVLSAVTEKQT